MCRGLVIKNVTVDDGGSYKYKATQSGYGITDFRDLVIHLKIEREFDIIHCFSDYSESESMH